MTRVGIIGFGEAGRAFAQVLAAKGARVLAYDRAWKKTAAKEAAQRPGEGIEFGSRSVLLAGSEIVLSTVTTAAAMAAAEAALPNLRPGQYYCDLNSTAPAVKLALRDLIAPSGAHFVEGAILGAIGVGGGTTRILLGGPRAETLSRELNRWGLNTAPYAREIGQASTFKMLRSIFSKGLEALLIEFLMAGRAAGLEADLWQEVSDLFAAHDFDAVARNWVCSHALAHERRYHELVQVAAFLDHLDQEAIMTGAALQVFRRSGELGLSRDFAGRPEEMMEVVEALLRRAAKGPEGRR